MMQLMENTSTQVRDTDWATRERQTALRSMHCGRVQPKRTPSSGWGTDVAGSDRRSVRASLEGRGDFRSAWWSLYCRMYFAAVPGADLERVMFSYHRMHHVLTLTWLGYLVSVRSTARDIRTDGIVAAVKNAVSALSTDVAN
jgi:hypothetical protein